MEPDPVEFDDSKSHAATDVTQEEHRADQSSGACDPHCPLLGQIPCDQVMHSRASLL